MTTPKRGQLTPHIQKNFKDVMGYDLTRYEFRLMPYVMSSALDSKALDTKHLNTEEMEIIEDWISLDLIRDPYGELEITPKFWPVITKMLWIGYINYRNEPIGEGDGVKKS